MSDGTSLLFDLPGFRVVSCELTALGVRRLLVMQVAEVYACPRRGVLAGGKLYDLRESRLKDLPFGRRPLEVIWRKRRYRCVEPRCSQRVFTERSAQVPPRCQLTGRLRQRLEQAASVSACPGGACTRRLFLPRSSASRCRRRCGCSGWMRPGPARRAGPGVMEMAGGCRTRG